MNGDLTQTHGEFVGVSDLHFAIVTSDTQEEYEAETPQFLAPAATVAGQPKISVQPTYYDNKPFQTYIGEGETELKVVVSNVPASLMAKLLGKHFDEATGRVYDSGTPKPPDVALGFKFNKGQSGSRYYWYLKGVFSGGSEDAETKKDQVTVKTYELTYTAVTTSMKWLFGNEMQPLKRVFGDTSETAFDGATWFEKVQTPTVSTAPAQAAATRAKASAAATAAEATS